MADARWAGRAAALALAVAVAVGLGACGDDGQAGTGPATGATPTDTTATTSVTPSVATSAPGRVIEVTVRGGSVEGRPDRQRVSLNERVRLRVTGDTADEVHVHGYERRAEVVAGRTTEISFVADIPGVFEVELERSRRRLLTLEVQP